MAARTIWKGSISFGLVNIPVQVFVATQKDEFSSFNQLDEKGHKIKYKKWCPIEEREIPWSEIKKGYEITKNNYVVLEKEDLENIKLKTTHTIEINEFIDSEEFDPLFIEKTYYIGPDTGMTKKKKNTPPSTSKAYSLFVKILNETNKIAIGKVVLRDKEHLVALRSYQRGLIMHQLKYLDEIKPMDEVEGISSAQQPKVEDKELSLGKTLVANLTSEQFDIGKYSDSYSEEVKKLIEAKSKGQKVTIGKEEDKVEDTTNLLEALKASIDLKSKPRRQKK
ncbi:MAG TPA: Ku protein [Nitrososphaeraceae archaeon]|nr:Ku protein [Nitrososphaeraceae archaeon]